MSDIIAELYNTPFWTKVRNMVTEGRKFINSDPFSKKENIEEMSPEEYKEFMTIQKQNITRSFIPKTYKPSPLTAEPGDATMWHLQKAGCVGMIGNKGIKIK